MTNFIIGERGCGKTTRLILRSAMEGSPIVAATEREVWNIRNMAEVMEVDIPEPISVSKYFHDKQINPSSYRNGILIDNVDLVLHALFPGVRIREVTLSNMNNIELLDVVSNKYNVKKDEIVDALNSIPEEYLVSRADIEKILGEGNS